MDPHVRSPKGKTLSDFEMMGLPAKVVAALDKMGITDPTPIQKQAIPHAINGRDVMGLAQTGTGKTAAFGVPLVSQMLEIGKKPEKKTVRGLVLAPTRELANQIAVQLRALTEDSPLKVGVVVGGQSINAQIKRLERGTDLLVATPGRLLDLLDRKAVLLDACTFLVLDEADQMLDLGFIHALRKIAALLPSERQTMLFSATMPKQMNELAQSYLNRPIRIEVSPPGKAADKITQEIHFIAKAEKTDLLIELLDKHRDDLALVFGRTKHGSEKLMRVLEKKGFAVASIHGNKSQGQRDRAIAAFKAGEIKVLVATDVAARGLDIANLEAVVNVDVSKDAEVHVHRIGRTGRVDASGLALSLCAPNEKKWVRAIEEYQNTQASWYKLGGTTASGERANPNRLTAAHRSLPFGTLVDVTNLANGKTVTVRINDRGPFAKGRVIDVTWAAAKELGFVRRGITRVKLSSKTGKISSEYKQICQ